MSNPQSPNSHNEDIHDNSSSVSGPPRRQLTAFQKIIVAVVVLAMFLVFIWVGERPNPRKEDIKAPELGISPNTGTFKAAPIVEPPAPPLPVPTAQPSLMPAAPQTHEIRPADTPIFAFSGAAPSAQQSDRKTTVDLQPIKQTTDQLNEGGNALSERLKPTVLSAASATVLPHPDLMITEGTTIPCILQTAIDTNLAGYVKCILPQDVRSTTGNVVLLDRGTTVIGEIQAGLQRGQSRVFVLWDRAETPTHVLISLASPSADELGRSGLPGEVNNHFWERFGSAILLSVVQGSLQAGTAMASNSGGGSGVSINTFQTNGEQLANKALRSSEDIPATLTKNQGDNISIFVARDLDFSGVYKLRDLRLGAH